MERYWRTREDPFEGVWGEIVVLLEAAPERTAKSVFGELQERYPGRFPDVQLRARIELEAALMGAAVIPGVHPQVVWAAQPTL